MSVTIDKLVRESRLRRQDVATIIATAYRRYQTYEIKKRSGGERTINHPARELKAIQRILLQGLKEEFPVHEAATAYEGGSSIVQNALAHSGCSYLLKTDIKNFFPSLRDHHWIKICREASIESDLENISCQVFFKGRSHGRRKLTIGAPSSPFVSNRLLYAFDLEFSEYCTEMDLNYTRYADDLAISGQIKFDQGAVVSRAASLLSSSLGLSINSAKTHFLQPGQRKTVTGLVLKESGGVSLGRREKRRIKASVHHFFHNSPIESQSKICGHLALLKMVDPQAFLNLKSRYGHGLGAQLFPEKN